MSPYPLENNLLLESDYNQLLFGGGEESSTTFNRSMLKPNRSKVAIVLADIWLLLAKNFKVHIRHPIQCAVELLLPCLLVLLLALFRTKVEVAQQNSTIYPAFEFENITAVHQNVKLLVLYTPENDTTIQVMDLVAHNTRDRYDIEPKPFVNTSTMVDFYLNNNDNLTNSMVLCGINFVKLDKKEINFQLRFPSVPRMLSKKPSREDWKTLFITPEISFPGPREKNRIDGGTPGYAVEGFLMVQHELSLAAAQVLYTSAPNASVVHGSSLSSQSAKQKIDKREQFQFLAQRFPFPAYLEDFYLFSLNFMFPSVIVFSFIYSSVNLVKSLVVEKEQRLKESMKMMGLKEKYHWIAYFIQSILWTIPSLVVIVILLTVKMSPHTVPIFISDRGVLFLFFFLYEICNICLCFMVSSFFSKANLAGIVTGVLCFFTFLPFLATFSQFNNISFLTKVLLCFMPNTNMAYGLFIVITKEINSIPITWYNLSEEGASSKDLTMAIVLSMMFGNSCLYLLVTWYVTLAFPGEYGVPLPWYFPFTKKYWTNDELDFSKLNQNLHIESNSNQKDTIEADPKNLKVGIQVENISKTYDNGKNFSVKQLSFNIYYNQITALLGHNGAGKTTTISMLVGLFKPSGGTAYINGCDIRHDMNKIRSTLGICPQFNVLFDELTVEEHLEFYCKLKHTNLSATQIKSEVAIMIEKLDLLDKRKVQSCKLSGGMKRKLSVGIALIGGSKIVILDEPTSGMDVSARRFIWDLLLKEKQNRAIIISTHFMEEADILGDRIAIMANGELQCIGSPLFLKKRFGTGYHLTLAKRDTTVETHNITEVVKNYIPDAALESSVGVEVTYSLPDKDTKQFEPLLDKIETDQSLGIVNYGISITTMEEVFLKVGEYSKDKIDSITNLNDVVDDRVLGDSSATISKNQGIGLLWQQLYALLAKKVLYTIRSPKLVIAQLFLPSLIILVSLLSLRAIPRLYDSPMLHMSLSQFYQPVVFYFYDNYSVDLASQYRNSLKRQITDDNRIVGLPFVDENEINKEIFKLPSSVYTYLFQISTLIKRTQDNIYRIVALFNDQAYHTPAISVKHVDETVIRYLHNITDSFHLRVTNYPLPLTLDERLKTSPVTYQIQFQIMQSLVLALSFLAGSFSVLVVTERVSKGKHLQKVCGVPLSIYWLSNFLVDYFIYILSGGLIVLTYVLEKEQALHENQQPCYMLLCFVLNGLSILPCVYSLSFMFKSPATSYARLCLYLTVLGIVAVLSDMITALPQLNLLDANKVIKPIFALFIPVYNVGVIAKNLMQNFENTNICNSHQFGWSVQDCYKSNVPNNTIPCCKNLCTNNCIQFEENFLAWDEPGIGRNLVFACVCSCIYWIILAFLEFNIFGKIQNLFSFQIFTRKSEPSVEHNNEGLNIDGGIDDDVLQEKARIDSLAMNIGNYSNPLIVRNLVKRYGAFTAVDNISYSIEQGECFGLLGVNGAGKTTTFKMITGDESITSGDIYVNGINVRNDLKNVFQNIGYCPQFDALLDDLTGEETLRMYSRLRGIKENDIDQQINELSQLLYFQMHINKRVHEYSGGNKRKLSSAIALMGNPSISFLDEPTTGVDPVARRCLWGAIGNKLKQGCSVVLTSHSMEECEALCNRLIIMVNGQICCIGSPLHLKNKFGNSYTVLIKVSQVDSDHSISTGSQLEHRTSFNFTNSMERKQNDTILANNLQLTRSFMQQTFPTSSLKAIHNNLLHYTVQNNDDIQVKCSEIFGKIESAKEELKIVDYSVSQTNLEQIFLSFARTQRDETGTENSAG